MGKKSVPVTGRTLTCCVLFGCLVLFCILFHMVDLHSLPWLKIKPTSSSFHFLSVPETVYVGSSNRSANSTTAECNTTDWKRINKVLNESGLPEDFAYMSYEVCKPRQPQVSRTRLIVNLNRQSWWFPGDKYYQNVFRKCRYSACKFTDDQKLLSEADAVFVTVCSLNIKTPPPRYSPKQIWIAFALESPVHYSGFHDSPSWKNVFNWTMGYRTDSDVFFPYGVLTVRSAPSMKNYTSIALKKTRAIAWFVSNCRTQSKRERYVKELKKHIDVDVYGGCSNRKCSRNGESDCLQLLSTTYYFYLSFENSVCQDYVTEKFFKIFKNIDVVPIVRGGANYSRYFAPGTFLNTADFPSPKGLAIHLKTLIADPQAYARLLQTKDQIVSIPYDSLKMVCNLCEHLHTLGSESKQYPDFMKWTRDYKCQVPSDI